MTLQNPAHNGQLKSAILKGVYDDNLKIESKRPSTKRTGLTKKQSKLLKFSFFLLAGTFIVSLYLDPWNLKKEVTINEKMTGTPAVLVSADVNEAKARVPIPVPALAFASPASSQYPPYISQQSSTEPVELFSEKLLDYSLILNDNNVRLSSIFGLDVKTIVIDPGHGGRDPGAIGSMGTEEKDIVLDIAQRLQRKLQSSGQFNVILTRKSDISMSLADRVEFANSGKTDLFISLHVNALPQKRENLIETYYYGPPSDEETLLIAEQENKGSGLMTKDFEDMIKKIGNTFKEQESASLAGAIQHSLFTNVKKYDKDIADAGIKFAPFVVLLGVDAPSVLVEISCISKKQEELKLNLPTYRDEITSFIAEGITQYLAKRNLYFVKGEENGHQNQKERS